MYLGSRYSLPKGIRALLIITVGIYILQIIPRIGVWCFVLGALKPSLVFPGAQIWRLGTYMFLHNSMSPWHILFNMLALWMFGVELEQKWGTKRFIYFYFIGGIGSGLISLILIKLGDPFIIGASGAILAILTVYAYYFPDRRILIFFLFPVRVRVAVIIFGAISLMGAVQSAGGIAHLTHLGGIIVAILYLRYYNKVIAWDTHRRAVSAEKTMRQRAEKKIQKDRYFEDVIDPILKKIAEQGMDSLTDEEKRELKRASNKERE